MDIYWSVLAGMWLQAGEGETSLRDLPPLVATLPN